MKPVNATKSLRSIRSARSVKSMRGLHNEGDKVVQVPVDFENTLSIACAKYQCPYGVVVIKEYQRDDYYKALKQAELSRPKRISIMPPYTKTTSQQPDDLVLSDELNLISSPSIDYNVIKVKSVYDSQHNLGAIEINKVTKVPKIMLRTIALFVPYYRKLSKISIISCGIDMNAILELSKLINVSTITHVCLDESPLTEEDYAILLEVSQLRQLSLCRCKINDNVCQVIASKLHYMAPAQNLSLLNLSSNHITDLGAKYIGAALRTNRHLRYLNLADNRINDEGADHVLDALIEFPLHHDEILDKKRRYMEYLKYKQSLFLKCLTEYYTKITEQKNLTDRKSPMKSKKSSTTTLKSKSSGRHEKEKPQSVNDEDVIRAKVDELVGPFKDPFSKQSVIIRNGYTFSLGNMELCFLNLSYNNLSFLTVAKIQKILMYQNATKKLNESGLMRVMLDGNNIPMNCPELMNISDLLNKKMGRYSRIGEVRRRLTKS